MTAGVAGSQPAKDLLATDSSLAAGAIGGSDRGPDRAPVISRDNGGERPLVRGQVIEPLSEVEKMMAAEAVATAIENADTKLWTSTALNLWTRPDAKAQNVGEIDGGERVLVTGRSIKGREEIVLDGKSRWVTAGYLTSEEPLSIGGECTNGSSVPSGVSPNIVKVHEAVCANFPEITSYGTFRSDGEHAQGIAIDIMVSGERGWQVAEFVRENYAELGVSYVIYSQQIWSVERSGEGWRGMEDRGSTTANHYDHVHVTTY